ncbi:MAG TPA: NAD-dependent epimerase/dehydratase family protein [Gemmata sp.]|jgi:nucleoside-diphosphate-sugar epimerase|nr:NAD-dependent epimerase/dehydratase family protein [Gemmata sp.]
MQGSTSLWYGRRVMVTGCSGFLGAAVTRELLNRQAHVIALMGNRNAGKHFSSDYGSGQFHIAQGRLDDSARIYTILAIHEVSAIFHLIDEPSHSEVTAYPRGINRQVDDSGTTAILRAAELLHPRLPVVVAKPSAQLRIVGDSGGNPIGTARFGELFGPDDRSTSHIIPRTIAGLLVGERINAHTDASQDYVFIRDAARACLSLAEALGTGAEPLDVTFRSGWELNDVEMSSYTSDVFYGREPKHSLLETPANPLGWHPVMSFRDSVAETIEWYRENTLARSVFARSADPVRNAA